jgi:hypothetical protein
MSKTKRVSPCLVTSPSTICFMCGFTAGKYHKQRGSRQLFPIYPIGEPALLPHIL